MRPSSRPPTALATAMARLAPSATSTVTRVLRSAAPSARRARFPMPSCPFPPCPFPADPFPASSLPGVFVARLAVVCRVREGVPVTSGGCPGRSGSHPCRRRKTGNALRGHARTTSRRNHERRGRRQPRLGARGVQKVHEPLRRPHHRRRRDGWPVEAGRYRLVVSRPARGRAARWSCGGCSVWRTRCRSPSPTRSRTTQLAVHPRPGGRDPVLGIRYLARGVRRAARPEYAGGISVPAIVDVPSGQLVTNDYQQITLDLATQWTALHRPGAPDLYPERRRDEIDEVMADVYETSTTVSTGPGSPRRRRSTRRRTRVSSACSTCSERLAAQRYLVGDTSPRPTSGCSPRWCASTRSTTVTSSATAENDRGSGAGATPGTSSRRPASATPSTSTTSSGTTTGCTPASTRPDRAARARRVRLVTPHRREELGGRPFGDGTRPDRCGRASEEVPAHRSALTLSSLRTRRHT